jgi:fibro-slime domain-containing protein
MSKPLGLSLLISVAILVLSPAIFAQSPQGLNGKTIHLYVGSEDFSAFYIQNEDLPLAKSSAFTHTITLSGLVVDQQDFYFSSNGSRSTNERFYWKLGKTGLSDTGVVNFTLADFQGKDTLWVIVDPAGPITAPPVLMLEAPKTIHVLNPWTTTVPVLVWGGNKTRKMSTTPGRCGWFNTMLLDPTLVSGHFADLNRTATYGLGGLGSSVAFDFTPKFATLGKSIWLNTKANTWSAVWPNVQGDCQYSIAATIRDFSKNHPDFDFGSITGDFLMKGMVENQISAARKPVRTAKAPNPPVTFSRFDDWWTTDTNSATAAELRRSESCLDIPMTQTNDGKWEYSSYRDAPARGFWPINGTLNYHKETSASCYVKPPPDSTSWVTGGPPVNGNFCMESHATFIYQPGQTFDFRGDDDVWIFINDKLLIDLGGVHTPKSASVDLDLLNLVPGQEYKWDLFYCDRQPCGSALNMKTSIIFKQPEPLFGKTIPGPTPGSVSLDIWKLDYEPGYCPSMGDVAVDSVRATNLTYQLLDGLDNVVETLGMGTHHGGITLATAQITIDTARLASSILAPGAHYRVVAFEAAHSALMVEFPFRMPGTTTGLTPRKAPAGKHRIPRTRNLLGRIIDHFRPAPPR